MKKNLLKTLLITASLAMGTSAWGQVNVLPFSANFDDGTLCGFDGGTNKEDSYVGRALSVTNTTSTLYFDIDTSTDGNQPYVLQDGEVVTFNFTAFQGWVSTAGTNATVSINDNEGRSLVSYTYQMGSGTGTCNITDISFGGATVADFANVFAQSNSTTTGKSANGFYSESNNKQYYVSTEGYNPNITITVSKTGEVSFAIKYTSNNGAVDKVYSTTLSEVDDIANFSITCNETNEERAIAIDNFTITSNKVITVDKPTGEIISVDGINRTVEFSTVTEGATLYKSETVDGTYTSFDGKVTVSTSQVIYVKAILEGVESDVLAYEVEAGTEVKLNVPVFSKTLWKDGKATYDISSDQSSVLLTPTATVVCDDAAVVVGDKTVTLAEGTYKFHTECAGYANSDDVTLTVVADREMAIVETLDFLTPSNDYNAGVTLSTTSEYNHGSIYYYPFSYASSYSEENREERLLTREVLFARANFGLQNQMSGARNIAVKGLKAGQIIKIEAGNTNGTSLGIAPTEVSKAVFANESTVSVPAIEVLQDGIVAMTIGRNTYIKYIYVYALPVEVSVSTAGLATFCSEYGVDFSSASNVAAYKAVVSGTTVNLTKVTSAAAGEGVLLRSVGGGATSETLPVLATATKAEDNAFVGTLSDINVSEDDGTKINYVLSKEGDEVGFYKAAVAGTKVGAGKAYLPVAKSAAAKGLTFVYSDDATGISEIATDVNRTADGAIYSLSGVHVQNPSKGLYIMNGKKVIVK